MLIRVGSSHSGIKEYLEKGQKQDRFFSRDELDERVIIAGNLTQTNAIINSNVRSQYRATALSAYSMLSSIPYLIGAYAVGYVIDSSSVNAVISFFGILLILFAFYAFITTKKTQQV